MEQEMRERYGKRDEQKEGESKRNAAISSCGFHYF
jgi:hypothetical protein